MSSIARPKPFVATAASSPPLTENAPDVTIVKTVISGHTTTVPAILLPDSSAPVALLASETIIPTGTQASSSAQSLSGELQTLLPTLKAWIQHDDDEDTVVRRIQITQDHAKKLLGGLHNGGHSSRPKKKPGCTASLFNLVSCIVGGLSKAVDDVENVAKNLLDKVIPELEGFMEHLDDNFGDEDDSDDNNDDSSSPHSSSEASTTSSSTCTKASTVFDYFTMFHPTLISSSATMASTVITSTITGCDITATSSATTVSTSTSSTSTAGQLYQTFWIDPQPPETPEEDLRAISAELMRDFANMGLLPISIGTAGTHGTGTGASPSTFATSTSPVLTSTTSAANPAGGIASLLGNKALLSSLSSQNTVLKSDTSSAPVVAGNANAAQMSSILSDLAATASTSTTAAPTGTAIPNVGEYCASQTFTTGLCGPESNDITTAV